MNARPSTEQALRRKENERLAAETHEAGRQAGIKQAAAYLRHAYPESPLWAEVRALERVTADEILGEEPTDDP